MILCRAMVNGRAMHSTVVEDWNDTTDWMAKTWLKIHAEVAKDRLTNQLQQITFDLQQRD